MWQELRKFDIDSVCAEIACPEPDSRGEMQLEDDKPAPEPLGVETLLMELQDQQLAKSAGTVSPDIVVPSADEILGLSPAIREGSFVKHAELSPEEMSLRKRNAYPRPKAESVKPKGSGFTAFVEKHPEFANLVSGENLILDTLADLDFSDIEEDAKRLAARLTAEWEAAA